MSCPARAIGATVPCPDPEEARAHARDLERRIASYEREQAFESGMHQGKRVAYRGIVDAALVGLAIGLGLVVLDSLAAALFES